MAFMAVEMFQNIACCVDDSYVKEDRTLQAAFESTAFYSFGEKKMHRLLKETVLACVNGCTSENVSTSFSRISFYSCSATWKCEI